MSDDNIDLVNFTDLELIEELSSRHSNFIVIKPDRKNEDRLKIFCTTDRGEGAPYELHAAINMLHTAVHAITDDCFNNKQNFMSDDDNDDDIDDSDSLENWKIG